MRPEGWREAVRARPATATGRKGAVLLVAAVAFGLVAYDLVYFAHGTYRGPVGDAALYLQKARLLVALWDGRPPLPAVAFPNAFPPDVAPDASHLGLSATLPLLASQGAAYPVFLALVQMALGPGADKVRLVQALLHAADAVLVYALAARAGSRAVGVLALLLFAAYAAPIGIASQVLSENLCTFLLLAACFLAVRLWDGAVTGRPRPALAALLGLTLIAVALTRPVYLPLAAFGAAGMAGVLGWRLRRERTLAVGVSALLVAGAFLGPYLAWQTALSRAVGDGHFHWMVTGPRAIDASLAESYDVANRGWPHPFAFVAYPGISPHPPTPWASVRAHPVESATLRAEKLYRLWKSPATIYDDPLVLPSGLADVLHAVLVLGAACGAVLARRGPVVPLAAVPVLYTTAVYTLYFSEERRFAFPAMPFVVILCAVALPWLIGAARRALGGAGRNRGLAALALWGVPTAAAAAWLAAFPGTAPGAALPAAVAYGGAAALLVWGLFVAAWWVARAVSRETSPARGRLAFAGAAVLLVLPVAVHLAHYGDWHTWRLTLSGPGEAAVQVFLLPRPLAPGEMARARLLVDMRDEDGRVDDLEVRVNDVPQRRLVRAARLPRSVKYVVANLAPLRPDLDWDALDVVPGMHQWLTYELDPEALAGTRTVTVSVRRTGPPGKAGAITLFGDANWGDPAAYRGPRPWLTKEEFGALKVLQFAGRASIWRYQTYGDMRLYDGGRLAGPSRSTYVTLGPPGPDGRQAARLRADDLSTAPLVQAGSYRIRLQLISRDGVEVLL